jgi:ankyrin repeat protein
MEPPPLPPQQQDGQPLLPPPAPLNNPPLMSYELYCACEDGDIATVIRCIDIDGENVNCDDFEGDTPISIAIWKGRLRLAKMLKERGANLMTVNDYGQNLLHRAAMYNHGTEPISWVLDNTNIDVNSTDGDGYTAILLTMDVDRTGWRSSVELLVKTGGNLSIAATNGWNALHYASIYGDVSNIEWILDNSTIDINSVNNEGCTSIIRAIELANWDAAKLLLARGADLSKGVDEAGRNALHIAAKDNEIEKLEWVVKNSTIDVNSRDTEGNTPLAEAIRFGEFDNAKCLLENGGNLFLKNKKGERVIDATHLFKGNSALGPQVLEHAHNLRWDSAKNFFILSAACNSPNRRAFTNSLDGNITAITKQFISARIAASVLGNQDIARTIASFILRGIVVSDPEVEKQPEPDAVKRRIEAELEANSKKAKKGK